MRKLIVLVGLCLALLATPAMAAVNLGLPINTPINFDGNGVFTQSSGPVGDQYGPTAVPIDSELYGVGTISGVALMSDLGSPVWEPGDVGPNFEMTFVFWDAVVTDSSRIWISGTPGVGTSLLTATYTDTARMLIVQDTSKDFTGVGGPGLFDLVDGEYPNAYTLEDAGYNTDGAADGLSDFTYANDTGEEVFLDLMFSGNSSVISYSMTQGFLGGQFSSSYVEILGGSGASQFSDFIGPDGSADAFVITFAPGYGWLFGGDMDVQLTTVPEPSTLIFLGTGLVSVIGYGLRRKMA